MARRPRPVDPDEGPLQAFAYDLRQLREKAGNPTYRILAKKAGYSPATLSEAARGQRRPSLDVTMAYVGACGGDADEWRLRWQDLPTTEPALATKPVVETVTEPPAPVVAPPPVEPVPVPAPPRRGMRTPVLAGAIVVAAAVAGVVVLTKPWASDKPHASGCPRVVAGASSFTGQTYRFSRVRTAAALSAPVARTIPADCTVAFNGYCLGDVVTDGTSHTPDVRWFTLVGGGVMSSGVIHGNPPANLGPSSCPGGIPWPTTVRLKVRRTDNVLRLQATGGVGVKIVGFASLDTSESTDARWRQITGPAPSPSALFEARWQPTPGSPKAGRHITVVAVACLGGDGPTTVIDAREIQPGDGLRTKPTSLSGTALTAATQSACQYP